MKAIVVVSSLLVTPAMAATGSELLGFSEEYGRGFVWGVANSLVTIASPNERAITQFRRDCFVNAKISDDTFYQAVVNWVRNHPNALASEATGSLF